MVQTLPATVSSPPVASRWTLTARIAAVLAFVGSAAIILALDSSSTVGARGQQTISAYVFTSPVIFTTSVVLLVAGSVALLASLIREKLVGAVGVAFMLVWIAGMSAVAIFPKHDWSVGPSLSGHIHRAASLVAFIALPLAVLIIARRSVRRGGPLAGRLAVGFSVAALLVLGYLVGAVVSSQWTGVPWWRAIELGLTERVLIGFEVAALAALAFWRTSTPRPISA